MILSHAHPNTISCAPKYKQTHTNTALRLAHQPPQPPRQPRSRRERRVVAPREQEPVRRDGGWVCAAVIRVSALTTPIPRLET